MSVADALVGIEATLTGLSSAQGLARVLREQMRGEGGEEAGRQLLDEARVTMLTTAREAIDTVKNGVTAFVDGDFDRAALVAAAGQLAGVRGALLILERADAAALLAHTSAMVEDVAEGRISVAAESFAESLADLLICVEYYLTALEYAEDPDPLMLKLGREGLLAMRGSVSSS
jgi:chemosensory pili system protein ChpA (sensor histidine kinase/response regulator)